MIIGTSGANYERLHGGILKAENARSSSVEKLSSGKKVNKAADNPGALAAIAAFEAQTRGITQQLNTVQSEYSMLQTADGALADTGSAISRINELSVQAANGTLTDSDRQSIQKEIDQLTNQIDMTAHSTNFNTKPLLDGSLNVNLSTGQNFTQPAATAEGLGLKGIDVTSQSSASSAINATADALGSLASQRGNIGAVMNGITSEYANLQNSLVNASAARSTLEDADMAAEIIKNNSAQLQSQFAMNAFQMNNINASRVLGLIGA